VSSINQKEQSKGKRVQVLMIKGTEKIAIELARNFEDSPV
jgi:hypothetical protein